MAVRSRLVHGVVRTASNSPFVVEDFSTGKKQ